MGLARCGKCWALHREEEEGDQDQGVLPDWVSVVWNKREPWCEVDPGCREGQCLLEFHRGHRCQGRAEWV